MEMKRTSVIGSGSVLISQITAGGRRIKHTSSKYCCFMWASMETFYRRTSNQPCLPNGTI